MEALTLLLGVILISSVGIAIISWIDDLKGVKPHRKRR